MAQNLITIAMCYVLQRMMSHAFEKRDEIIEDDMSMLSVTMGTVKLVYRQCLQQTVTNAVAVIKATTTIVRFVVIMQIAMIIDFTGQAILQAARVVVEHDERSLPICMTIKCIKEWTLMILQLDHWEYRTRKVQREQTARARSARAIKEWRANVESTAAIFAQKRSAIAMRLSTDGEEFRGRVSRIRTVVSDTCSYQTWTLLRERRTTLASVLGVAINEIMTNESKVWTKALSQAEKEESEHDGRKPSRIKRAMRRSRPMMLLTGWMFAFFLSCAVATADNSSQATQVIALQHIMISCKATTSGQSEAAYHR